MEATINVETLKIKFVGGKNLAVQPTVNIAISFTILNYVCCKIPKSFKIENYILSQLFTEDIVIGESLVLEKVTREDMGKYMCIARNTVQPAASKIFDLSVNCKYYKGSQAWQKIITIVFMMSDCLQK